MQQLQKFLDILLAIAVRVRLVQQAQHLDEYVQAGEDHLVLHLLIEEELLEDADRRHAELAVAQSD